MGERRFHVKRWLILLALGCADNGDLFPEDPMCGSEEDTDKAADLSFGRYGGLRDAGELWYGLEKAAKRWETAACLGVDVAIYPETWVRWRVAADMPPGATGLASGPFDDARIHIADTMPAEALIPALVHEMGHILRRNYGHPCEDGSMSWPVVHVFTPPPSRITECDLARVCAVQDCGCQFPEPEAE